MKNKIRKPKPKKLLVKDHLSELVMRVYVWVTVFLIGSIVGYLNHQILLEWLIVPLKQPLYYTSPVGGFETVITISLLCGYIISLPVLVYECIMFVAPIGTRKGSLIILGLLFSSLLLAILGIIISYYLVFPASLAILGKFGSEQLESLISTKDYFSFATKYLLGFAILFQLPLIIYLISFITPLTPKLLIKKLDFVIVASFLMAALLTPTPDFINQAIMAAPMICLYLLTILILYVKQTILK